MTTETKKEINEVQMAASHRAVYVNLLKPRAFKKAGQDKGDPKYGASFLFTAEDADLKKLQAEVIAALKAKFPGKKLVPRRLTQEEMDRGDTVEVQVPWKDGTKQADKAKAENKRAEELRGFIVVKSSSKYQPNLSALVNKKLEEFNTEEAVAANAKYFYSGAWMVPCFGVNVYNGDERNPPGASLYLNAVLFHKNDTRIGGQRKSAAETFKNFVGTISEEDPTEGQAAGELAEADDAF